MLFYLVCSHFICDYPLQSSYMAIGKNPKSRNEGPAWFWIMAAHCFTHGAGVALATGSVWLGVAEVVAHFCIDTGKCLGWYDLNFDQIMHLVCKVAWWLMALAFLDNPLARL